MPLDRKILFAITVAALGYFVDIFDLLLFGIVRVPSLRDIGVPADQLLDVGSRIQNMQMVGMLLGGVLWGVLGDKRGRLSVLFGSILLYSLASLANTWVTTAEGYAWLRFVAGVGLAGELGAGITLVSELLPAATRGIGTTVVAATGIAGAVVASYCGEHLPWRHCYLIGGVMGLLLLLLRIGTLESGLYAKLREQPIARGSLLLLLTSPRRLLRYLTVILIGLPIWYVVGILVIFSPEIGAAMGMIEPPKASLAIRYCYIGLVLGDLGSGLLSQRLSSRKRAVALFLLLTAVLIGAYFVVGARSLTTFYLLTGLLGFAGGYWAVFITMAAEQFGTNIRATVTTTAPNVVRGAVPLLTLLFTSGKGVLGVPGSALAVGTLVIGIAGIALLKLEETYGRPLDYLET